MFENTTNFEKSISIESVELLSLKKSTETMKNSEGASMLDGPYQSLSDAELPKINSAIEY